MRLLRVNKRNKCQICGYADWCGISEDGKTAVCMRVSSMKQAKNGGYIHSLSGSDEKTVVRNFNHKPEIVKPKVERSATEIDEVYRAFLAHLVLAIRHENDLRRRGLGIVAIQIGGYKSMPSPTFATKICEQLARNFDLSNIPGFYFKQNKWQFQTYFGASGYLIPIRNRKHEIRALQLRQDDNRQPKYLLISSMGSPLGASSGAPAHFATMGKPIKRETVSELIITEGALKANIIQEFTDIPVVGLVSVTTFNDSLPDFLREAFPNLAKIQIAFDLDAATNEAVKNQRTRLVKTLDAADIDASILTWNRSYKGFDDYLSAQKMAA